jgi:flagellar biosynthesis/type III secretory pathway chaperone
MVDLKIKSLIEQIQNLLTHHEKLLEIIKKEKEALASADLAAIQACTYQKEIELESIRIAESRRQQLSSAIEHDWGLEAGLLKISDIIERLNQSGFLNEAIELSTLVKKLVNVIEQISEMNTYNKEIIQKSLIHVDRMKQNVIRQASSSRDVYSHRGQKKIQGGAATRFISKEA